MTSYHSLQRRDFIRIGGLTALGLTASETSQRTVSAEPGAGKIRAKSCILIWLDGGPSHLDTFDPKPDAPTEVRGPFDTVATPIPGVRFSEMLAKTAAIADRLAIIRSMTSPLGEHGLANHYLLTGYHPSPVLRYPSLGSVVSHERQSSRDSVLPP